MSDVFERLAAPFPPEAISWRVGSMTKDKSKARALAYLNARDVMRRFDEVIGPARWQTDYVAMPNGTFCCRIGVLCDARGQNEGEWVWKANGADSTDIEGVKGGYSDSFKRAAVLWGVGQYLYDLDSPWVRVNEWKQIHEDELPKLQALLRGEKPKSAYQTRKDDEYPKVEAALRAAAKRGADVLASVWREWQPVITKWPDGWRESISDEKDRLKNELAQQAEAAA